MSVTTRAWMLMLVLAPGVTACSSDSRPPTVPSTVLQVLDVSPKAGFAGTELRIDGRGFSAGATVTIGGTPAAAARVVDIGYISATVPPGPEGTVDVVVTGRDGQTARLAGAFTYQRVTLMASATEVRAGNPLSVSWVAPAGRSADDWIGFFRLEDSNFAYENGWWEYTSGAASGSRTITAPSPGQYEFRYLLDDGYQDVARSAVVTVRQ